MHAYVRTYEKVTGIYLLDVRNAFVEFVPDDDSLFRIAVVQVNVFLVAEPYGAVVVYEAVAYGDVQALRLAFGKFVYQLETVVLALVAEYAPVLADFP